MSKKLSNTLIESLRRQYRNGNLSYEDIVKICKIKNIDIKEIIDNESKD